MAHDASRPPARCGFDGGVLTLAVPSFLAKERIEGRYLSLVRDALTEIGAANVELALEIAPSEPEPQWTVAARRRTGAATRPPRLGRRVASRYTTSTLGTPSRPS